MGETDCRRTDFIKRVLREVTGVRRIHEDQAKLLTMECFTFVSMPVCWGLTRILTA